MSDMIAIKPPRKQQIRPGVEAALQLIVQRGLPFFEAAEAVGYKPESLAKALRRPHVLDRLADIKREWMDARTFRAWVGMAELADSAVSEEVRHKSYKVFLEAAGELGGKSDAPHPIGVAVQIIVGSGPDRREVLISDGGSNGVIEAQPWAPAAPSATDDDDD
ncbi:hypothetical protein [Brevundimonas sp. TWP2-3-4b1]|uniref:hypothetical protein n=1 Tax=Brevundimonas sp. TWP2-3-4b1 TaxID=2804580 RepID=UPI003CED61A5